MEIDTNFTGERSADDDEPQEESAANKTEPAGGVEENNASNGQSEITLEAEKEEAKICDIAGVCTIKFNTQELHKKYFDMVKNFLEHLLRESADDFSQLFCVDTARTETSMPLKQFYTSLNNSSLIEENAESSSKGGGKNCFNCLGDHHINECPNPIDRKAVAENRRKLQTKSAGSNARFFEDEDRNVRFMPGKWSKRLLEAMGVRSNEIPPFVYRMRVLGYPPGWLTEAEERSSGLKLFDGLGNEVSGQDLSGDEDGLVEDEVTVRYNPEKLIGVPGFNVDLPSGAVDDFWRMGMPPMQPHQSKAAAIASMNQTKGADPKPRRLKLPPPKNSPSETIKNDQESSLKRPADPVDAGDEGNDASPIKQRKIEETQDSEFVSPTTSAMTPQKAVVGTPIPQSISNVETLPSAEKWSEGVAEHIPYENLPGATGTFEKMRGLLLKIKDLRKTD